MEKKKKEEEEEEEEEDGVEKMRGLVKAGFAEVALTTIYSAILMTMYILLFQIAKTDELNIEDAIMHHSPWYPRTAPSTHSANDPKCTPRFTIPGA